jgi:hypothetical protein
MRSASSPTALILAIICGPLLARSAAAWPVPPDPQPAATEAPVVVPSVDAQPPPAPPPAPEPPAPPADNGVGIDAGESLPSEGVEPDKDKDKDKDKKGKKKKKDKDKDGGGGPGGISNVRSNYGIGEIRLGGWFFARGELQRLDRETTRTITLPDGSMQLMPYERTIHPLDLSVPSVRFRVDYLSPWPWLTGQLEMDFAGKPDLRDGYVQAKGEHVAFRMGQFKMPVLAMQMESPWALPMIRRGLIHDLTVDWLDVAGRLPGAMLTLRGKFADIKPRLFLGAFQARALGQVVAPGDRDTDLVTERPFGSQKLVARGQVDIGSVEIGAVYEHRLGSPGLGQLRRLWTAGGDFTVNHVFATGGLRIWVDGLAGASWYSLTGGDATFVATRALVAYRFGGVVPEAFYVEPYLFGGLFDPDLNVTSDLAYEATAGVNVGFWGRARVTLQAEVDRAQRNFPRTFPNGSAGYLGGLSPDRMGLIAQVGLAY